MRPTYLSFLTLAALELSILPVGQAQQKPVDKVVDKVQVMGFVPAVPTIGPRAEFLEEIAYFEQRYTRLAETMPAEKYTWRRERFGCCSSYHSRQLQFRSEDYHGSHQRPAEALASPKEFFQLSAYHYSPAQR